MEEVLFQITKDQLETGLRGYPVGYCVTSTVDPTKGLFYAGQPVEKLAFRPPEEVIFLLYKGKEGTPSEIAAFKEELKKRAHCSEECIQAIQKLPRKGHPMKLFVSGLLLSGMFEATGDYREDCINMIAKIPQISAAAIAHHAGWKLRPSQPELGYIENFVHMLNPPGVDGQNFTEIMKVFNVLHYDHGGGNLSVFVGKAVASGLEDLYGSLAAAMCALAGPRHGRANQDGLLFVHEILKEVGENASTKDVENALRQRLQNQGLVFGFGHAVLRIEDPRAAVLYGIAQQKYPHHPLVKMALLLREAGPVVLKENSKIADPYPNVDAISGTLLSAAGFAHPDYFTILFGLARTVGISIQIVYERCEAREGKGTPIVRPKYLYKPRV